MVRVKLYLDKYLEEYLTSFGDLEHVVNHCVDYAMANPEIWLQAERCPPRDRYCRQLTVNIHNTEYEEYRNTIGEQSRYCSVRRLLYYMYNYELLADNPPGEQASLSVQEARIANLDFEFITLWNKMIALSQKASIADRPWADSLLEAANSLKEHMNGV